ncbi:MAG: arginine--tRNA ligase [Rhodobacterales bacterium]|nr:arginine--tRNA ligase [Rhodobacterales bacterium]
MTTIAQSLTELVRVAADAAGYADSPVPLEPCVATNNPDHGDYQSNYAFRVGKSLRTNPRAVAQAVVDALPSSEMIAKAEVAGPGFINFTLSDAWLSSDVQRRCRDARLGAPSPGAGRTVVIDFSSPNIAKRMHVGHLRSTIIGDALRRLYSFAGWNVIADNHVGDWGTPFGMLIVAWHEWRDDAAYDADAIAELQRLYQLFRENAKADEALMVRARAETAKLQAGDEENAALWTQFVMASMAEFDLVYDRLGVEFTVTLGESFYQPKLAQIIQDLLDRKIAIINYGAVVVPFTAEDGKGLGKNPLLIRKSDGAALYGTTDLATVLHRVETWSPERVIYETDNRQQQHFKHIFAASKKMGVTHVDFRHVFHGILRFPDGAVVSTRAGGSGTTNLIDVLNTAVSRARAVVDEKSASLPEAERAVIAETVGVGAVKYFDLSQNPASDITFDWDRSLSMEGNSAPYLMYAHARCCSIVRRAAERGVVAGDLRLLEPAERNLALAVARTADAALLAAETNRPNLLCDHLYTVAQSLSRFYVNCRVLGDDVDDATSASRLTLVAGVAQALRTGLDLVGVGTPSRM